MSARAFHEDARAKRSGPSREPPLFAPRPKVSNSSAVAAAALRCCGSLLLLRCSEFEEEVSSSIIMNDERNPKRQPFFERE